jgi:hypothetical protein
VIDILAPGGIRILSPSKQAATDPCLRLRERWDLLLSLLPLLNYFQNKIACLINEGRMMVSEKISEVAIFPGHCHYFSQRVP